jgi:maltooligosyltrehalose trehalohydrolase
MGQGLLTAEIAALTGAPRGRRYPVGAEPVDGGYSFRVFAPDAKSVLVETEAGRSFPLDAEADGYHSATLPLAAGDRYWLRLDGSDERFADPASRFQPEGLEGPSQLVDARGFMWTDGSWRGLRPEGQVLYELHIGTFTPEGTWAAAVGKLGWLKDIGITAIEVMPVAEFGAAFGWGYDGVLQYSPTRLYGNPDDFRRFIDAAHAQGIGVMLDIVYNHLGPGARFEAFAKSYFRDDIENEWARPMDFRVRTAAGPRAYFVANAIYWIDEFHLDGLRIDAAHAMEDDSSEHVISEIVRKTRAAAGDRGILITAESEPERITMVRPPAAGGHGIDAMWNEDFHHSAMAAAWSRHEAYMHDHRGAPQEFVGVAKYGTLFQGQRYDWQDRGRGAYGLDLGPVHFINYLQNHDQVANSGGLRFHQRASPARARVLTTLLLLSPQTPILFQGEEFAADTPFYYFLGVTGEMAEAVKQSRLDFLAQFQSLRDPPALESIAVPSDPETFARSKLDWREAETHAEAVALHRDLIAMRRSDPALSRQAASREGGVDGAVIGPDALLLRFFGARGEDDRLLLVNLGRDLNLRSIPEPLAAPPAGHDWVQSWSSEEHKYGGGGRRAMDLTTRSVLSGEVAVLFTAGPARPRPVMAPDDMEQYQHALF